MTCIVAVSDGERVTLGGDSAGIAELELTLRADTKVFRSSTYAIGFTSSFRMGQLLRYGARLPEPTADLERFMVTSFIDAVREVLKEGGFASKENEAERGGAFLVGIGAEIFEIGIDYQVGRSVRPYAAVGCGARIALGAMHALERLPTLSREQRALAALEAAEAFSAGVRRPFHLVTTPRLG